MFIPKLRFNHVHKHVNMANFDYFPDLFLARFTSLNHSITKYTKKPKLVIHLFILI
jgi:tRNA(Leu) C34 or U34 (ribose-2'-O)-methylase TrmL